MHCAVRGYGYDANGNQTGRGSDTRTYVHHDPRDVFAHRLALASMEASPGVYADVTGGVTHGAGRS